MGNVNAGTEGKLRHDAENRLVKMTSDSNGYVYIARMAYDGDGRRAKRVDNFGTIHYAGPHYERNVGTGSDTTEVITKYYYAQMGAMKRLIALRRAGTLYYVVPDHLGGTLRVVDSAGNTVDDIRFHAFGATRSGGTNTPTDKRFTGQTLDQSTGLYDLGARSFDPLLGRFCQPDSIVPQPGNPQSLNRYSYCRNNPLKYRDPSGHGEEYDTAPQQQLHEPANPPGDDGQNASAGDVTRAGTEVVGDSEKGLFANGTVPHRYDLYGPENGKPPVLRINDLEAPGKYGQWIIRVDEPHARTDFPHINLNKTLVRASDPHLTRIGAGSLKAIEKSTAAVLLARSARVAVPVALAVDAASIYTAYQSDQGVGPHAKEAIGSAAGGWGGACAGAFAGAEVGAMVGFVRGPAGAGGGRGCWRHRGRNSGRSWGLSGRGLGCERILAVILIGNERACPSSAAHKWDPIQHWTR